MKIKTQDVRSAFDVANNVEAISSIESSQFARLKQDGEELAISLTGTLWAEAKIATPPAGKWTAYADRRALKAFLDTCSGAEIDVAYKPKVGLEMRSGQRMEVPLHAAIAGYEAWKPSSSFKLGDEEKEALRAAVRFLPSLPGMENLGAVWFFPDGVIATDGIFLFSSAFKSARKSKDGFFLPSSVAGVLSKSDTGKVSTDASGVGAILDDGVVFQPDSTALDSFPKEHCLKMVSSARKSSACARFKTADLTDALCVAVQFFFDKNETVLMEPKDKGFQLTVNGPSGVFQRKIPALQSSAAAGQVSWPARKIIPWLDHVASVGIDEVEFARFSGIQGDQASALSGTRKGSREQLLFVNS